MPFAAHPQAACARALRNCWGPHSETGRLAVYIPSHLIAVNECVHGTGPEQGHPLITTRMCVYTYIIVQETLQLPALIGNSFGSCASAHLRASCRGVRSQDSGEAACFNGVRLFDMHAAGELRQPNRQTAVVEERC